MVGGVLEPTGVGNDGVRGRWEGSILKGIEDSSAIVMLSGDDTVRIILAG